MSDGVPEWLPPAWLDPERKPRRNTANHVSDIDFIARQHRCRRATETHELSAGDRHDRAPGSRRCAVPPRSARIMLPQPRSMSCGRDRLRPPGTAASSRRRRLVRAAMREIKDQPDQHAGRDDRDPEPLQVEPLPRSRPSRPCRAGTTRSPRPAPGRERHRCHAASAGRHGCRSRGAAPCVRPSPPPCRRPAGLRRISRADLLGPRCAPSRRPSRLLVGVGVGLDGGAGPGGPCGLRGERRLDRGDDVGVVAILDRRVGDDRDPLRVGVVDRSSPRECRPYRAARSSVTAEPPRRGAGEPSAASTSGSSGTECRPMP